MFINRVKLGAKQRPPFPHSPAFQVHTALNAFWGSSGRKAQKKVVYLMNSVGAELVKYIRDLIPHVWHGHYIAVMTQLQSALVVLEKWAKITEELPRAAVHEPEVYIACPPGNRPHLWY